MTRRGVTAIVHGAMPRLQPDYLVERATWSATITYVVFAGLVTLIALPMEQHIGEVSADAGGTLAVFTALFCLLFGVLTITMGQAERRWRGRLSFGGQLRQLSARVLFALALALPYWIAYMTGHVRSLSALALIVVHLGLWGLMLGLAGWRLALAPWSDIVGFNVKYASFFGYLILSGLGQLVPFVSIVGPFHALDGVMSHGVEAWGLLVQSAVVWIVLGVALGISIRRVYERS